MAADRAQLNAFLSFTRKNRSAFLKELDQTFDDVRESRVLEPQYTRGEVEEIIRSFRGAIHAATQDELRRVAHQSCMLQAQLLDQGRRAGIELFTDLSIIESKDRLAEVAALEDDATADLRELVREEKRGEICASGSTGGKKEADEVVIPVAEAEAELAKSGGGMAQLTNFRMILNRKNVQIKALREAIQKLDPTYDLSGYE